MLFKIRQVGEPVLRVPARTLTQEEILDPALQRLIGYMRDTMYDAPGVGLAAPQIGEPIRLAVLEDRSETMRASTQAELEARERRAVPFQVIVNPVLTVEEPGPLRFFEGCLSVQGFTAVVPRAQRVRVEALDERANPVVISASGWYARILQHEIDHLNGVLYLDRMEVRTFMSLENHARFWREHSVEEVRAALGTG